MNGNAVPFTQYTLPHGRKSEVCIVTSPEIARLAQSVLVKGNVFECEILTTGQVSITARDPDHGDIACEVVPNGPQVMKAVEKVIRSAAKWCAA